MSAALLQRSVAALPAELTHKTQTLDALLARIAAEYAPATLASSLSIEDMVITAAKQRTIETTRGYAQFAAVADGLQKELDKGGCSSSTTRPSSASRA